MKAFVKSVRIAPKKANLVAKMVRGMPVREAIESLERTNKKAARILEDALKSALANARHNEKQNPDVLVVKTIEVNKAQAYHRGVPMARGRVRPMRKFLSHILVTLGIEGVTEETKKVAAPRAEKTSAKKAGKAASQPVKKKVQSVRSESKDAEPSKEDASAVADQASKASAETDSSRDS